MKKCCICGKQFNGWGNNPYPVKESGKCCDECNSTQVIPARLKRLKQLINYGNKENITQ